MRLIDADALKEYFKTIRKYHVGKYSEWYLADVLEQQPTVDAVPVRHGKWIDTEAIRINTGEIRKARTCSICGAGYFRYDLEGDVIGDVPRYCPNCGARMVEDE